MDEAVDTAEDLIKDVLRAQSMLPFHREKLSEHYAPDRIKRILGLEEVGADEIKRVFGLAGERANATVSGLKVAAFALNGGEVSGLDLSLEGGAEWTDALRYAHGTGTGDASQILSPPADELLRRIQNGELTDNFFSEQSVRSRIRLYGYSSEFDRVIAEIRRKKGLEVLVEHQGNQHHRKGHSMRFGMRPAPVAPTNMAPGLNPVLTLPTAAVAKEREFGRWIKEYLSAGERTGQELLPIWRIGSRAEFFRCFPTLTADGKIESSRLIELLSAVQENRHFGLGWNLEYHALEWTVVARPKVSWEEARARLKADLARPTPEVEFGLSTQAAGLYEWIRALDLGALEFGLSPSVEKAVREKRFPIAEGLQRNLRTVIELLCEEITERTSYQLRVIEWLEGYHDKATRIRIRHNIARDG